MPVPAPPSVVHLGGLPKSQLLDALAAANIALNPAANELFADPRFEPGAAALDVVITYRSVATLGFSDGATHAELVESARGRGLTACALEVGPYLRLQFRDQPEPPSGLPPTQNRAPSGSITVMSAPLDESDDTPKGFYLRRMDGVLWLRGYRSWVGHVWSPDDVLVFEVG